MAFHLWWDRHDGMRGHVWLQNPQMQALREELLAQGMLCGDEGGAGIPLRALETPGDWFVPAIEIEEALEAASPEPRTIEDERLWVDFLVFLEGAASHGGLRVKP